MTGYLMVRCGTCGATNKIRALGQPPPCEACSLPVSKFEIPQAGMLLAPAVSPTVVLDPRNRLKV